MSAPAVTTPGANVHEFTTELVVRCRSTPAEGVVVLDLAHPENEELPRWEPGAHIDLLLDDGLTRQYSLCGDPRNSGIWRVGILLDPNSRGGSRYVHEELHEGATVRVRGPRNHFPLVDAQHYRFIAGGIGITPILAMLEAAQRAGTEWTLLYGGRTKASMAFADELAERFPSRVTVWPQDELGLLDLESLLKEPDDNTLVYCCGPEALLDAVEQHCAHWPAGRLHIERFAAKTLAAGEATEALEQFEVVCQRSGVSFEIGSDQSILEVLEEAGVPILGSCYEGVCGTCEARVLQGTPEHRDSVLTEAEQAAGDVMLVCVSRSRTERLVLDL
ncbi:ferredoxin [Mycobacterium gordonae]|uniref:Ferredoxin n=1 Tax=Mycobacterium gordonae TaxID=1778 RepID=A0A0Q2QMF1_MYCGO|nr:MULTISPECIES: PDR/VanB family oxidoreductase [Mycobacterium]KQH80997.1 ferredoxin [Mycobacterium gordonae]MDP7731255.1 PDR/VanB family oxidoreductase [Mycobacterium sp. TY813]